MRGLYSFFITLLFSICSLAVNIQPQVIYNADDRKEIFNELPHDTMAFIQQRTLAMVSNAKLFPQTNGELLFLPRHYGRAFKLCKDERFYEQTSLPHCTASVIGKDLVLTAGHCISEEGCPNIRFIADYIMDGNTSPVRTYAEKIYHCKKVHYDNETYGHDVAIVQIDRDFAFTPLLLATTPLTIKDEILAVGFPSGLPMKSSGLGPIRTITENVITAELETYGGNSGSPIFKKDSDQIAGILVAGEDDYVLADSKMCYKTKVCDSHSCQGEEIISAQVIQKILKDLGI